MQAHKKLGGLFMEDNPCVKMGRRVFEKLLKKAKTPQPIHFHNTCFYRTEILGKNAKRDI